MSDAFNVFTADWKNRIESLLKVVILLSGGVMSITVNTYINASNQEGFEVPELSSLTMSYSWYLFTASLIASLCLYTLIALAGYWTQEQFKKGMKNNEGSRLIDVPKWVYKVGISFLVIAFLCCSIGLVLTAVGASFLIK
jgi:hypothetical protein